VKELDTDFTEKLDADCADFFTTNLLAAGFYTDGVGAVEISAGC